MAKGDDARGLSLALNRVGHHIRQTIVDQARASLGDLQYVPLSARVGAPEPIPDNQEEINNQADAVIRDLFPRIPNSDRQTIIEHSFKKVSKPCPLYHKSMIQQVFLTPSGCDSKWPAFGRASP